jgi:hypothetical protein
MQYFQNILSKEQYQYVINKTLLGSTWRFTNYSNSDNPQQQMKFWFLELADDPFFTGEFLSIIENLTQKKWEIERVYANGQTHGLSGYLHPDVSTDYMPELYSTFLFYVNPEWNVQMGGATVIINNDNTVDTVFPSPNTGMLFDSALLHYGAEPSRYCAELRVTVAFKLKEIV